jgi:hypothetical protein
MTTVVLYSTYIRMHGHVGLRCCPSLNLRSFVPIRIQIGQYPFTSMEEVTSLVISVVQVPLFVRLAQLSFVLPLVIRLSYLSFVSFFWFFERMVNERQYSSSLKCSPG